MRVLAVLVAACLLSGCISKPVPERQRLYKRDDVGTGGGSRSKLSRNFNVVDDLLATLDQCFHVLQEAVDKCAPESNNKPTSVSQELSDEREESDDRRKGNDRKTEPPPTPEPPTTSPPKPSSGPNSGTTVIVVHGQDEKQEKTADQQSIGNRKTKERGRTDEPPTTKTVIVHVDRGGKQKSDGGNQENDDESAESQVLGKSDNALFDRDDRKEKEEKEESPKPLPTNVVVVHVDREEGGDSETADASSQSVGKDRERGRDDGDDEKPTPDVVVIHINRKGEATSQQENKETGSSPLSAVEQSRRKPTEALTEPTTAVPTTENPPIDVIVIHADRKEDTSEAAEAEGLRRTEPTEPPTDPPTEPPIHRSNNFSKPSTDVIVIHRDRPSNAEIESDVEYAMQYYWSRRQPTEPPTEATQTPPTSPPRGPVRVVIIPDARDESIDEIVSQVNAYSVGDRLRFRNNNEEEDLTESPSTEPLTDPDYFPLIIVIDRRPPPTTATTSTESQTDPPTEESSAVKIIHFAAKKLKTETLLEPVNSQAKGGTGKGEMREGKEGFDPERIDLDDLRDRKKKIELELEREGMFMYPVAQESSRENDESRKNSSTDSEDDSSSRRNKTTDANDLPTEETGSTTSDASTEEPSATIETDASDSPTSDSGTNADTGKPTGGKHSQSGNTEEQPSDSTANTTDHPTDSDSTDTDSTDNTQSPDTATDSPTTRGRTTHDSTDDTDNTQSPDRATDSPTTHSTEPEAKAGEWPMESVFYEKSIKSSSVESKQTGVVDKTLEDYLHFRRRRQDDSSQFTPQECLQLFGSVIEEHYIERLKFLDK